MRRERERERKGGENGMCFVEMGKALNLSLV